MEPLYKEDEVVDLFYNQATRALLVIWQDLSPDTHVRRCCEVQLDQVQAGAQYLIIDVTEAKGLVSEVMHQWFVGTLFPQFEAAGLKGLFTINPRNQESRSAARRWMTLASAYDFRAWEVDTIDEALTLIGT